MSVEGPDAVSAGVGKIIARGIGPVASISARRRSPAARCAGCWSWRSTGTGGCPAPRPHAARQLQRHGGSVDGAIAGIIDFHVRLASAQGFVTNLGGVAVMPVTVPANLAGVAVVQVRMVAAIAHLRGYDLDDNRVRTALVMCLLGGEQVAKRIAGRASCPPRRWPWPRRRCSTPSWTGRSPRRCSVA